MQVLCVILCVIVLVHVRLCVAVRVWVMVCVLAWTPFEREGAQTERQSPYLSLCVRQRQGQRERVQRER